MEQRKDKIVDVDATRKYLEDGNYFFASEAEKMGLIDKVTNPDQFF